MTVSALSHTSERKANTSNGGLMLLVALGLLAATVWAFIDVVANDNALMALPLVVLALGLTLVLLGFYTLQPNEAAADHPVRQLQGHGPHARPALGAVLVHAQEDQRARAQRHRRKAQGER